MSNPIVVFSEPGVVTIETQDVPEPNPDEVLIETRRTLVSTGTELTILGGEFPPGSKWAGHVEYPFVPGYNNIGEVIAVGEDVETIDVGQRVATYSSHAAYVVADAEDCRPVPDGVGDVEASFFTIAEIVMNGVRRGRLTWGETTVVYGLGLLGQLAVRCGHVAGARPVVGIDIAASRLSYLPEVSSIDGINPTDEDTASALKRAANGRLADVVFEVTGNQNIITDEFEVLRDQGRFVVLSSPRGETTLDLHDHCNGPSYEIIGAHNSSHPSVATPNNPWTQQRHCELFFDLLLDGSLSVEGLVSHEHSYEDAPALYNRLLNDRTDAMGVLLEW
ncbi:zinc-dependent alcohol dehydrogenase [Haloprofundus salinisoli]|uniref:zinc-dependent alcohol dehydrogenase n=1 Tax=Haloprofundus salinisoli TaxID=2876193 RepID=UPI001CCC6A89|nr:zinc-binding alcohol dehydrogenase [Haloprofundus salinisoli]